MRNTFDEATHTYTINGRVVPSVTQVLSDLIPGWHAGEWYLQRGTAVHACAAMIAQGIEFEHDPQIDGQVTAIRRYFAEVNPRTVEIEKMVFCDKYRYAGTVDMILENSTVVDYKASFGASLPYQLAAYALAYGDTNYGYGVEIHADGTYKMSEVYDLRRYKQGWLSLLTAYGIRRECKVKEVEEG